ncbi:MAG: hypothetical protein LBG52_01720 [Candidatus Peribacteria bacterium]|jgi:hypothetical protein|nr:hypothetical protein [Candidatus Peribacteria bacterium]
MITNIDETTRTRINDLIATGLEKGRSKNNITKKLQVDYAFSKYRSNLIVNTELGNAFIQ